MILGPRTELTLRIAAAAELEAGIPVGRRLERLAGIIAPMGGADPVLAARAAKLAKADLASGMVGERRRRRRSPGGAPAWWDADVTDGG